MPNWIEGTIKLRGKHENLYRFIKQGLEPSAWLSFDGEEKRPIEDFVEINDYDEIIIRNEPHIKGTRRAFIQDSNTYFDEDYNLIILPIKQAWCFDAESFAKLSKEFDIDIRLYGFECGMEFCQEIEIINGQVTINKEIEYSDYQWECPMPLMGG